jgi:hypothetical protein
VHSGDHAATLQPLEPTCLQRNREVSRAGE